MFRYYSTINYASGNVVEALKHDFFSYEKGPRAKIFAGIHSDVHDMDSMMPLMRSAGSGESEQEMFHSL